MSTSTSNEAWSVYHIYGSVTYAVHIIAEGSTRFVQNVGGEHGNPCATSRAIIGLGSRMTQYGGTLFLRWEKQRGNAVAVALKLAYDCKTG